MGHRTQPGGEGRHPSLSWELNKSQLEERWLQERKGGGWGGGKHQAWGSRQVAWCLRASQSWSSFTRYVPTLGGAHRGFWWGLTPPKPTARWGSTDTKQLVPRAEATPEKGGGGGCQHSSTWQQEEQRASPGGGRNAQGRERRSLGTAGGGTQSGCCTVGEGRGGHRGRQGPGRA